MADKLKYIKTDAWIIRRMKFKTLTQRTLFSIIYNFKDHTYKGARQYLAELLLCDVKTVDRSLKYLLDMGYIKKGFNPKSYGDKKFKRTRVYQTIVEEEDFTDSEIEENLNLIYWNNDNIYYK